MCFCICVYVCVYSFFFLFIKKMKKFSLLIKWFSKIKILFIKKKKEIKLKLKLKHVVHFIYFFLKSKLNNVNT